MKVVLVLFRNGKRREFPLDAPRTVLGRRPDCTLRIPTPDVSRRHCEIVVDSTKALVRDLGSSNGTYVNGKRVAEAPLRPGDRLTIGPAVFIVQIDGQPARITPESAMPGGVGGARAPSTGVGRPSPAGGAARSTAGGAVKPGAKPAAAPEDVIFELEESDLELDDPISALESVIEDEDEGQPKR